MVNKNYKNLKDEMWKLTILEIKEILSRCAIRWNDESLYEIAKDLK